MIYQWVDKTFRTCRDGATIAAIEPANGATLHIIRGKCLFFCQLICVSIEILLCTAHINKKSKHISFLLDHDNEPDGPDGPNNGNEPVTDEPGKYTFTNTNENNIMIIDINITRRQRYYF